MIKIILTYTVLKEDAEKKLLTILKENLNISARLITKLKKHKQIFVNNVEVYTSYIVKENDKVTVNIDFLDEDYIEPQEMKLEILYEDEYILAINKKPGIVVHPSSYHLENTLANGVKYYLNNGKKIHPINRLDRDTSGVVMFAKNEYIQECFTRIKPYKEYIAIINGKIVPNSGSIHLPIARKEGSILERCISEAGQDAITHYETLREFENYSLLKVNIETGRTHQIRVHFSYMGNSILGDTLYGLESKLISRQALHAYKLVFNHPITKKQIEIIAPLPDDINNLI